MPTRTRPTAPRIHATIRRSYEGRACPGEGRGTSLPVKGESRGGGPPSRAASRSGGCAPSYQESSRGGWAGKLGRLCRRAGGPNQRRNAGPSLPLAAAAARCGCRACPAHLPCFPLSISGHFSPRPSTSVRPAPYQIRLVPPFRPFQHPPAGPSAPHPARAWQIRLVSLCRLVRRASIPSCAAPPQARRSRKRRAAPFKANQAGADRRRATWATLTFER